MSNSVSVFSPQCSSWELLCDTQRDDPVGGCVHVCAVHLCFHKCTHQCLFVCQQNNETQHIYSNIAGKALWRNSHVQHINLMQKCIAIVCFMWPMTIVEVESANSMMHGVHSASANAHMAKQSIKRHEIWNHKSITCYCCLALKKLNSR